MSRHTILREGFRKLGLCGVCGKSPEPGYKTCRACLDRNGKTFQKHKAKGLCGCGNLPEGGRKKCKKCLILANERVSEFRSKGLCYCGKRHPKENYALCQKCLDRRNTKNRVLQSEGKCICGEPCGGRFKFCARCRNRSTQRMERLMGDKTFAFLIRLRGCVYGAIKKKWKCSKAGRTEFLIGCTFEFVRQHIESKFLTGMSWQNMHMWHIDHYIPCDAFDLRHERQQRLCNNWRNLRPMWAADNLSKKNKLPKDHAERLAELELHVPHINPMDDPCF
jgi:hypothetical protein